MCRSQPPPRKRRPESQRAALTRESVPTDVGAEPFRVDPRFSGLEVANDILRESLRLPPPPSLGTWLEERASTLLPHREGGRRDALDWLSERTVLQRCALSMGVGVLLGFGLVSIAANVLHWERAEVPVLAAAPQAVAVAQAAPQAVAVAQAAPQAVAVAPMATPAVAPVPAPVPQPAAQVLKEPQPKAVVEPAKKAKKKRGRLHSTPRSPAGTWTFPRPQRRSE